MLLQVGSYQVCTMLSDYELHNGYARLVWVKLYSPEKYLEDKIRNKDLPRISSYPLSMPKLLRTHLP